MMTTKATTSKRDFDNCAHVTKSGVRCSALRWYHDTARRHKFVEPPPTREQLVEEALEALSRLVAANNCNYELETMRSEGYFDRAEQLIAQIDEIDSKRSSPTSNE